MPSATNSTDDPKSRYGFWIIIIGLGTVLAVFFASIYKWSDAKDVAAAVGSVTGVVGTLAGAFFGVHAGAEGKDKADAERQQAQEKVERLAALLPPEQAIRGLGLQ